MSNRKMKSGLNHGARSFRNPRYEIRDLVGQLDRLDVDRLDTVLLAHFAGHNDILGDEIEQLPVLICRIVAGHRVDSVRGENADWLALLGAGHRAARVSGTLAVGFLADRA